MNVPYGTGHRLAIVVLGVAIFGVPWLVGERDALALLMGYAVGAFVGWGMRGVAESKVREEAED